MLHEKSKQRVVTFKADEDLAVFLDAMPNKSEFIRKALLSALLEPCTRSAMAPAQHSAQFALGLKAHFRAAGIHPLFVLRLRLLHAADGEAAQRRHG